MKSIEKLKKAQEALRERHWNPMTRWDVLQRTIAWAESQRAVRRNLPETCLRLQKKKLKQIKKATPN
jgi:hypothetical protein